MTGVAIGEAALATGIVTYDTQRSAQIIAEEEASSAPNFIVTPGGTAHLVPKGATGPVLVISPTSGNTTGSAFVGGSGGMNGQVESMRLMNPNYKNPTGYIKYENSITQGQQGVNPYTGQTGSYDSTHFPIDN